MKYYNIYYGLILCAAFLCCQEKKSELTNKLILSQEGIKSNSTEIVLRKILRHYNYTTGNVRNKIASIEGISFRTDDMDSTKFYYTFSIVNWRDQFSDIKGTLAIDSSTLYNKIYYIASADGSSNIEAIKLIDTKSKVVIGLSKDFKNARIFQESKGDFIELSKILWQK